MGEPVDSSHGHPTFGMLTAPVRRTDPGPLETTAVFHGCGGR
jgi:hypothetical protein